MAQNAPVEAKVKSATTASFLISLLVAVLNQAAADSSLLGPLPDWLQFIVVALIPPAVTLLAGYQARHTPRGPAGV